MAISFSVIDYFCVIVRMHKIGVITVFWVGHLEIIQQNLPAMNKNVVQFIKFTKFAPQFLKEEKSDAFINRRKTKAV